MPSGSRTARRPSGRSGSRVGSGNLPVGVWAAVAGSWRGNVDFVAMLVLLAACALGGGSSFAEVPSLLYVRPVAVACLVVFALTPAAIDRRTYRLPMLLLGVLAALMLVQLVPLPPAVWTALPGRAAYAGVAVAAGIAQPWRPLSLTPDLTLNALAALVVPAAALVGAAKLRADQRQAVVVAVVALCCVSGLLGIAQFAAGKDSALYLYRRTYPGFPVGLLSNRNHQAALLSILFPALRMWTLMPAASRAGARNRQWLALGLGVFTVPVVLATGSRAGIVLMGLGIAAAFLLFPAPREAGSHAAGRGVGPRRLLGIALPAAAVALVALTYWLGRAASIERLLALSSDSDQRFQFAPTVLRVVRESFPAGTGFGSFDPVFRQYEPDAILISSYFNHAHNELLELAIMAGLPGLALLAAFLVWWGLRVRAVAGTDGVHDGGVRLARLGAVATAFILLASLFDYPLRAPLMAAIFAIGCAWLCERESRGRAGVGAGGGIVTSRDSG